MAANNFILEICCYNTASCLIAGQAGAHRIELCAGPRVGGTTPARKMIKWAKEHIALPIHPIIRPRGGDFIYTADELEEMKKDIRFCKEMGCEGIATGMQLPAGGIATEQLKRLVDWAYPMQVTCHKVFDATPDPFVALEEIIACGCSCILTSGHHATAIEGMSILKELIVAAGVRIAIMAGGGVRSANIKQLAGGTGTRIFHSSALTANTIDDIADEIEIRSMLSIMAAVKARSML